mgnify:CR=1 FL=1
MPYVFNPFTGTFDWTNAGGTGTHIYMHSHDGTSTTNSGGLLATNSTWSYHGYGANSISLTATKAGGLNLMAPNASGVIKFFTGGDNTSNERMRIDSSGNVGIGVTPTAKLHVYAGNVSTLGQVSNAGLAISGAGATNNYAQIGLGYAGTYQPASIGYITTTQTGYTFGDLIFANRGVNTDTAPTEKMRLDSSGNLNVGTTGVDGNLKFKQTPCILYWDDFNI